MLTFRASQQKIDGLMDITAREAGSFYTPGRTTVWWDWAPPPTSPTSTTPSL